MVKLVGVMNIELHLPGRILQRQKTMLFLRFAAACILLVVFIIFCIASDAQEDKVYSGPQEGEVLPAFTVQGVYDDAEKELDYVTEAGKEPLLLIFVHDVNRQSISMTRVLSQYAKERSSDGLQAGVIFLDRDPLEAESRLQRIRHALTPGVRTSYSPEGLEGPGELGLNRRVMLTVLLAKSGVVVANFAMIQPSLNVDLPKIVASVCDAIGGEPPKIEDLLRDGGMSGMRTANATAEAPNLRALVGPLIRLDASPVEVDRIATDIEEQASRDDAIRRELGRIASTIVKSGKLSNYGTEKAREYLAKWAKEFADEAIREPEDKSPRR